MVSTWLLALTLAANNTISAVTRAAVFINKSPENMATALFYGAMVYEADHCERIIIFRVSDSPCSRLSVSG
jgi:hypothetical protein